MVQVGSFFGGCILHAVVTVVVEIVLENTLVVRMRVDVVFKYTVTWDGVVVIVRVMVVEGTVMVEGGKVVKYVSVIVVVIVVEGVVVTVNVAVGVDVMTTGGPAMIEKVLIQAKVKPSMITIQSPENISFLVNSFPGISLFVDTVSARYGAS